VFYINVLLTNTKGKEMDVALLFSVVMSLDSIETVPDFEESHRTPEGCNS